MHFTVVSAFIVASHFFCRGGSKNYIILLRVGLTCFRSLSSVVCAVLKKPQPDWFTVTVSFQSQQWQCGLCCVEETTARLVYCNSILPITAVTMWSVLCWRNPNQTGLLRQRPSNHSSDNVVCAVLKKPQPDWFTVTFSFQSQQRWCHSYFDQDKRSEVQLWKHWWR